MEVEPVVLVEPDESDIDSLASLYDPEELANEQTWPTEEEMQSKNESSDVSAIPDAATGTTPKRVRRIPKGMSEYQASWIVDEDDEDDDAGSVDDNEGSIATDIQKNEDEVPAMPDDDQEMELESHQDVHFQGLDVDEDNKQYVRSAPPRPRVPSIFAQAREVANS
jgi:pre-rRNA-processing protein TSR1